MNPHLNARRTALPRVIVALLIGVMVAAITACSSGEQPTTEKPILRVATQPNDFQRIVLERSGVLEGLPFDIEWSKFSSGNETVEALNAQAVDLVMFSYGASHIIAQSNAPTEWTADDAPFKIVGMSRQYDELSAQAIVVPENSTATSLEDLRGKRIGFANGGAGHYYFLKAIGDKGMHPEDFQIARMNRTESASAFSSGALDALVTTYGNQGQMFVDTQNARILDTAFDTIDSYVLDVARTGALEDPDLGEAIGELIKRRVQADKWEQDNIAVIRQLQETEEKDSPAEAQRAAQILATTNYVPIDQQVVASQQDIVDVLTAQGIGQREVDVNVVFDDRYNDLVATELRLTGQSQ